MARILWLYVNMSDWGTFAFLVVRYLIQIVVVGGTLIGEMVKVVKNGGHGLGHRQSGGLVRVQVSGYGRKVMRIVRRGLGGKTKIRNLGGVNFSNKDKGIIVRSDMWVNEVTNIKNSVITFNQKDMTNMSREFENSNLSIGPGEDESTGLNTEGKKRSRTRHETKNTMDTDGLLQISGLIVTENTLMEATLSEGILLLAS